MNELQELLNRAFVDGDTGAYNKLSGAYNELSKKLEQTDYRLGQALRVARQYKAKLERCGALAREGEMTDLTAKELARRTATRSGCSSLPEWIEVLRRMEQLEKCEAEWQQPDDALLMIGAPGVPFLEQVEWMRKRLAALEEAARPFLDFYDDLDSHAMREAQKRLAEVLEKGN